MQPLEFATDEEIRKNQHIYLANLMAELKAEVPIVEGEHGPVAERHRIEIINRLAGLEMAARLLHITIGQSPQDANSFSEFLEVASTLYLEIAWLNQRFRDTAFTHGEA